MAIVSIDGVSLEISIALIDDLAVGDYVLVHVGYALAKIDPAEAERTLELLQELGNVEQELGS
ncbi:hydrogenase assembly protein HupF [Bradyrhizobium sp. NAS96.2]|nr:hydrogenase assembly protein HupF [Bradyrhizobium sp. NAS96.2]